MVVRNKSYNLIDKYIGLLNKKLALNDNKNSRKTHKNKLRIVDFFLKNGKWPSRLSKLKREKRLGTTFENYISKESHSYDKNFRRLTLVTGRTISGKRKHSFDFKKEILDFIKEHGRTPQRYSAETIPGEGRLRGNLDQYTLEKGDMSFLGEVYNADPCHRSGIPAKYRPLINSQLDVNKPLIRLV